MKDATRQPAAIELDAVSFRYDTERVVDGVSLVVPRGELHALVGASGSGKTTILRGVAGFERAVEGRIHVDGVAVDAGSAAPRSWVPPERRGVGLVFQDYALFPHLDVAGNVAFGMARRNPVRVEELLDSVGLGGYGERRVTELSGGEQQRVSLARALARDPSVLLLDEPFSNLDRALRRQLRAQTVQVLRQAGVASLFVTHDAEEAFAVADRIHVLSRGRLLQSGTPREVYESPRTATIARTVGDAISIPYAPSSVPDGRTGHLSTPFGEIEVVAEPGGTELLVRPEQLVIDSRGGDGRASFQVVDVRFFGPTALLVVRDESGTYYEVPSDPATAHGHERVAITVQGRARLLPA